MSSSKEVLTVSNMNKDQRKIHAYIKNDKTTDTSDQLGKGHLQTSVTVMRKD